jgi:hypothetical protein
MVYFLHLRSSSTDTDKIRDLDGYYCRLFFVWHAASFISGSSSLGAGGSLTVESGDGLDLIQMEAVEDQNPFADL